MLSILLKRSKHSYFLKYFEPNWNNIKSTWKGIKPLITLKDISTSILRTLNHNNKTVINPVEIAIIFNKHFVSIAEKARANVNYSHKYFSQYKENNSSNLFILSPTNKNEISSIISSFLQIVYLLRFLNYLRIKLKFHLIFMTSIISLFLWVYFHQSWKLPNSFLYIKRTQTSTTITLLQLSFTKYWKNLRKIGM